MKTLSLLTLVATVKSNLIDTCPSVGCNPVQGYKTVCAEYGDEDNKVRGCIVEQKCGSKFTGTDYILTCDISDGAAIKVVSAVTTLVTLVYLV